MLKVKPLDRTAIDAWPVDETGLPPRVVKGLLAGSVRCLGDVRGLSEAELRRLPGCGDRAMAVLHRLLEDCDRIERGELAFPSLRAVFDRFLTASDYQALNLRYGLHATEDGSPSRGATLQSVATALGVTRERTRQLLDRAEATLLGRLARACLEAVSPVIEEFIGRRGGAVTTDDLQELHDAAPLAGYDPAALAALFGACFGKPVNHGGFFSLAPADAVAALEKRVGDWLRKRGAPQTCAAILAAVSRDSIDIPPLPRVLTCLLQCRRAFQGTADGLYFVPETGLGAIVEDTLRRARAPAHYLTVLRELNSRLRPGGRKGAGTVLKIVRHDPRFVRTAPGYYALADPPRAEASQDP